MLGLVPIVSHFMDTGTGMLGHVPFHSTGIKRAHILRIV